MNRSLSGECFNDDFQYEILHVRVKLPHGCVLLSLQPLWLRLGISCRWLMEGRFKSNSPFIYDKNTIMNIMFVVTVPLYLILHIVWTCYGLYVNIQSGGIIQVTAPPYCFLTQDFGDHSCRNKHWSLLYAGMWFHSILII